MNGNGLEKDASCSQVTPHILRTLSKIGPQNISEIKFAVGRSKQGCYLRLDFLPAPAVNVEALPRKYVETGVSCCGDFPFDDNLTTCGLFYEGNETKCDVSIQTGRPQLSK
ncbi:hypothetical protein OSTOST_21272 [Ostertagia ostertagi]